MSRFSKIIIGSLLALILIGGALVFFLYRLATKSYPHTDGVLILPSLQKPVEVFRDEWGVPHILAQNEHDLMLTTGFVHAQDRLWQMELARRAGLGRLSEIFDTTTLKFDKMFRTLGFATLAHRLRNNMHPDSRRLLDDYTE
ncbi:MAG: penicillin acylase family protein, partial [Bacteroidetes bacterium]